MLVMEMVETRKYEGGPDRVEGSASNLGEAQPGSPWWLAQQDKA